MMLDLSVSDDKICKIPYISGTMRYAIGITKKGQKLKKVEEDIHKYLPYPTKRYGNFRRFIMFDFSKRIGTKEMFIDILGTMKNVEYIWNRYQGQKNRKGNNCKRKRKAELNETFETIRNSLALNYNMDFPDLRDIMDVWWDGDYKFFIEFKHLKFNMKQKRR